MDKKIMGLLGSASALALVGGAASAEAKALEPAQSYAELLNPISNAAQVLKADNERAADDPERPVQLAQYYHHHHHHHQHQAGVFIPLRNDDFIGWRRGAGSTLA